MFEALHDATRSSCLQLQTGAVIVKDKRIISSGYNGAAPGIKSSLELMSCRKEEQGVDFDDKGKSVCRGTHAEENAMRNIARQDLIETCIYTVYFPCSSCAKDIVGNDIGEVVFSRHYGDEDKLANEMFTEKGTKVRQLELDLDKQFRMIRDIYEYATKQEELFRKN